MSSSLYRYACHFSSRNKILQYHQEESRDFCKTPLIAGEITDGVQQEIARKHFSSAYSSDLWSRRCWEVSVGGELRTGSEDTYSGIFWIDASDRDTVEREFRLLYRLLFRDSLPANQDPPKMDDLFLRVRDWFVRRAKEEKFLLVFDGADDIEDAQKASYVNLNNFIPSSASVDIIITTRIATARIFGSFSVEVHEMEKDEALTLFYNSSGLERGQVAQSQQDDAERIVAELGYFALAINLAGSYLSNTPVLLKDLPRYLLRYRNQRKNLLDHKPSQLLHQYNESVLTTWEVSFEAVSRKSGVAANLLSFLAFLDAADNFPELFDLIGKTPVADTRKEKNVNGWENAICPERALTSYDIDEAFSTLQSFSMVRWIPDQATYSMHKLVHAWSHDRLDLNKQAGMVWATAHFLQTRMLFDLGPLNMKLRFSAHLMANYGTMSQTTSRSDLPQLNDLGLSILPFYANFLDKLGLWSGEAMIEYHIVKLAGHVLGSDHPATLSAMNDYARTLGDQGKHEEAAKMKKDVVEKMTRILGAEHPNTELATENLTILIISQGSSW